MRIEYLNRVDKKLFDILNSSSLITNYLLENAPVAPTFGFVRLPLFTPHLMLVLHYILCLKDTTTRVAIGRERIEESADVIVVVRFSCLLILESAVCWH